MLKLQYSVAGAEEKDAELIYKIACSDNLIDLIKKAAKFVTHDDLRPAMQCICLDFSSEGIQVVATDAHRMYYSKRCDCDIIEWRHKKDFQLLISYKSIAALCKSKRDFNNPCFINMYEDNSGDINNVPIEFFDARFPDYRCVIPKYEQKITFDRKDFIDKVKGVQVYANKSTNQVNFYFNGQIDMSAQDVDFAFESGTRMNYISKEFEDLHIGFNGTLLRECLSAFKTDEIDMYHIGGEASNKAAIFTDGKDSALLMPLIINS